MTGASIETTLELWASSLREVKRRIGPLFSQERSAVNAGMFLDGLLGDERRKTGWMRAEAAGDPGPWRQQALLGRDRWDADALRDLVREYVVEHLADDDAVLVIDETGFLKQGKASCGVARRYTGSAGKITNCQIGVFASYVSRHGHAFIDRALYLPKSWTSDPARLKVTHVPAEIEFATKPQLAAGMIARAIAARMPFAWVAADTVYGVGDVERDLRRVGKGYVLGVSSAHWFGSWNRTRPLGGSAEDIAKTLQPSDWQRLSAGAGTKGPRLHDWCYLELADLEAEEFNDENHGLWTRGLLIRRNIADGDLASEPGLGGTVRGRVSRPAGCRACSLRRAVAPRTIDVITRQCHHETNVITRRTAPWRSRANDARSGALPAPPGNCNTKAPLRRPRQRPPLLPAERQWRRRRPSLLRRSLRHHDLWRTLCHLDQGPDPRGRRPPSRLRRRRVVVPRHDLRRR